MVAGYTGNRVNIITLRQLQVLPAFFIVTIWQCGQQTYRKLIKQLQFMQEITIHIGILWEQPLAKEISQPMTQRILAKQFAE